LLAREGWRFPPSTLSFGLPAEPVYGPAALTGFESPVSGFDYDLIPDPFVGFTVEIPATVRSTLVRATARWVLGEGDSSRPRKFTQYRPVPALDISAISLIVKIILIFIWEVRT
jgi:hypothetical protein